MIWIQYPQEPCHAEVRKSVLLHKKRTYLALWRERGCNASPHAESSIFTCKKKYTRGMVSGTVK